MTYIYKSFFFPNAHFELRWNNTGFCLIVSNSGDLSLKIQGHLALGFHKLPFRLYDREEPESFEVVWWNVQDEMEIFGTLEQLGFYYTRKKDCLAPILHLRYNEDGSNCFLHGDIYYPGIRIYTDSPILKEHLSKTLSRFTPETQKYSLLLKETPQEDIKNFLLKADFSLMAEDLMYLA